jgi:hypothetical protein
LKKESDKTIQFVTFQNPFSVYNVNYIEIRFGQFEFYGGQSFNDESKRRTAGKAGLAV